MFEFTVLVAIFNNFLGRILVYPGFRISPDDPGRTEIALIAALDEFFKCQCRAAGRLQEHLEEDAPGVGIRETVLGHMVRGGRPSAMDRVIAQRLGLGAVLSLESGFHDVMASWDDPLGGGKTTDDPYVRMVDLTQVLEETKHLLTVQVRWFGSGSS